MKRTQQSALHTVLDRAPCEPQSDELVPHDHLLLERGDGEDQPIHMNR